MADKMGSSSYQAGDTGGSCGDYHESSHYMGHGMSMGAIHKTIGRVADPERLRRFSARHSGASGKRGMAGKLAKNQFNHLTGSNPYQQRR